MEPLPRGAQFTRSKMLWEIALGVAGDPAIPYYGNRDISVVIGNGSAESFRPWLRMSVGSPILAHAVARGDLELAFVKSLGHAYPGVSRGTGPFQAPLPLRVVASYPSWDRFVRCHAPADRAHFSRPGQGAALSAASLHPGGHHPFHARAHRPDAGALRVHVGRPGVLGRQLSA